MTISPYQPAMSDVRTMQRLIAQMNALRQRVQQIETLAYEPNSTNRRRQFLARTGTNGIPAATDLGDDEIEPGQADDVRVYYPKQGATPEAVSLMSTALHKVFNASSKPVPANHQGWVEEDTFNRLYWQEAGAEATADRDVIILLDNKTGYDLSYGEPVRIAGAGLIADDDPPGFESNLDQVVFSIARGSDSLAWQRGIAVLLEDIPDGGTGRAATQGWVQCRMPTPEYLDNQLGGGSFWTTIPDHSELRGMTLQWDATASRWVAWPTSWHCGACDAVLHEWITPPITGDTDRSWGIVNLTQPVNEWPLQQWHSLVEPSDFPPYGSWYPLLSDAGNAGWNDFFENHLESGQDRYWLRFLVSGYFHFWGAFNFRADITGKQPNHANVSVQLQGKSGFVVVESAPAFMYGKFDNQDSGIRVLTCPMQGGLQAQAGDLIAPELIVQSMDPPDLFTFDAYECNLFFMLTPNANASPGKVSRDFIQPYYP